jgi:hypothetical protein
VQFCLMYRVVPIFAATDVAIGPDQWMPIHVSSIFNVHPSESFIIIKTNNDFLLLITLVCVDQRPFQLKDVLCAC